MKRATLNINDIDVTEKQVEYTCYGLGSCVGLFVTDRLKNLSGGAHIPLPTPTYSGEFKDATRMIDELLAAFQKLGSDLNCLRAKITGGAQVYQNALNIGGQNSQEILVQLINRKIFIAAVDVGGTMARTARFNSVTNELQITTSDLTTYCI